MIKLKYRDLIVELKRIEELSYYNNNYYQVKENTSTEYATFKKDLVIYEKYYETCNIYDYHFGYVEDGKFKHLFTLSGFYNERYRQIEIDDKFIFKEV